MLKLNNIVKDYVSGDSVVKALKGIDIQFRESEFVSILGPSGCGKTTLLNIIGGLDRYTSGDLIINGKSTKNFKDKDWDAYRNHSIGFVFQNYNLIPHQTVLSNVELALTLSGVSKSERRQRAIDVLNQVGLGDQLHKKPNQMSGGQMQRVAIARALINDPDILLADEPTGALDSETSVQIMEILKNISQNKLIIMVTHNPELADKYSSRIIRLLDGKVTDDSKPYTEDINKADKAQKDRKKGRKTSMSFLTALSLSRNNLMTKKGRTLLTSFAGSIGIIGIALILSLSNGVQNYIDQVQEDTLSSYPLQITKTTTNIGEFIQSMSDEGVNHDHDMNKVYSRNQLGKQIETLLEETKVNNLEKFKSFIDKNDELKELTTDIQYSYSAPLTVYKADTSDKIVQVNPSTLLADTGFYSEEQINSMSSLGMANADVWSEMIDNEELIKNQYDVLAGKLPEKYNEIVLVVDKFNELNDYVLYTLGMLDSSKLNGVMKKAVAGEKIEIDSQQTSYTYDELMDLNFKLISPTDKFVKENGLWVDKSEDESFMKDVIDKGIELKVVGIVKPSEEASASSISGAIGYRHDLTTYLLDKVSSSEIVKDQISNPETDIFTGLKFASDEDRENKNIKVIGSDTHGGNEAESAQITDMSQLDQSKLTDVQKKYLQSLTDEQMALLKEMAKEQAEGIKAQQNSSSVVSSATYDENLEILGYSTEEKPSGINIYPKDFEAKERIVEIIDSYNDKGDEADKIEYTDMVGLMMSSVTTIINSISYVLIAFVAISLIVSSIMIGIITYISVLERTKEIGILRSIGASKRDISRVFNAETLIVGFAAGVIGIGISYLLTIPINAVIRHITDVSMRASIPVGGAVILVIISMVLTLIAGLFPSRIAAKKDPVVAL
ncbi:MAG: ABC transporter ATP-binding protein/permease, partial [Ruminococcus sp.]|nr:ABC transporter ATP-binding protein/permease [Ruminococcus sp.]